MIVRSNDGLADDVLLSARGVGLCYQSRRKQGGSRAFWPFRDLSFEIRSGETLGILGGNGAGKSTLMRVLAGLMQPDEGVLQIRKDINIQLLTIGLGFEQRLTGRENALLSGVLLGKSVAFMREHLDAIKEYSELGDFFEKAVYTYSSGMKARLGFSVAMRVDPKVLLLDEVMGVGDAAFRDKSSQAIEEMVFREGKTVVIISHNARVLRDVCSRALWIGEGRLMADGGVSQVADAYLRSVYSGKSRLVSSNDILEPSGLQDSSSRGDHVTAGNFIATVRKKIEVGDYEEAASLANKRLSENRLRLAEKVVIAEALLYFGDYQKLLESFWEDRLEDTDIAMNLGRAAFALGDLSVSLNCFQTAAKQSPMYYTIFFWMARICGLENRVEKAKFFYQQAVQKNTEMFARLFSISIDSLICNPLVDNIEAKRGELLGSNKCNSNTQLGWMLEFDGQFDESFLLLEVVHNKNNFNGDKKAFLSFMHISMLSGRFSFSRAALEHFLEDDPSNLAARLLFGFCSTRRLNDRASCN